MLVSRPIVAIQRTKVSNHSDGAKNNVHFWGLFSFLGSESIFLSSTSLSLSFSVHELPTFLIDSLD